MKNVFNRISKPNGDKFIIYISNKREIHIGCNSISDGYVSQCSDCSLNSEYRIECSLSGFNNAYMLFLCTGNKSRPFNKMNWSLVLVSKIKNKLYELYKLR